MQNVPVAHFEWRIAVLSTAAIGEAVSEADCDARSASPLGMRIGFPLWVKLSAKLTDEGLPSRWVLITPQPGIYDQIHCIYSR